MTHSVNFHDQFPLNSQVFTCILCVDILCIFLMSFGLRLVIGSSTDCLIIVHPDCGGEKRQSCINQHKYLRFKQNVQISTRP